MTNTNPTPGLDAIFDLADARNVEAAHMLTTYDPADTELGDVICLVAGVDVITDSTIDELVEELEGGWDDANDDDEEM